jgi:hypothetical protein
MFAEAAKVGGLQIQLVFFRGNECRSSEWTGNANALGAKMRTVGCIGGVTQWLKVLKHIRREHRQRPVSAVVMIGDCCEEPPDALYGMTAGLPKLFVFQEGDDPAASALFPELARRTKGLHFKLGPDSARQLGQFLRVVAAYAAGGLKALEGRRDAESVKLLEHALWRNWDRTAG